MKLDTVFEAKNLHFPQFTITKVVDFGEYCVVFVCDDEGQPLLIPPYEVHDNGEVTSYDYFSEGSIKHLQSGAVIYSDDTPLRRGEKPGENADGEKFEAEPFSVGVLVVNAGKILSGTRHNDFGYGLICGPGGHGEDGETPEQAAIRRSLVSRLLSLFCLVVARKRMRRTSRRICSSALTIRAFLSARTLRWSIPGSSHSKNSEISALRFSRRSLTA